MEREQAIKFMQDLLKLLIEKKVQICLSQLIFRRP